MHSKKLPGAFRAALAVVAAALLAQGAAAKDEVKSWTVAGAVTQDCAVAVACSPAFYAAATRGRPDALACELRVCDSKGLNVPYALRARKTRFVEEVREWQTLKIARVAETEGVLRVDVEWPPGAAVPQPARFFSLKVDTPLRDFEQAVEVSSEDVAIASGVLCDYHKFADMRVTEMPFETSFRRAFTVVFAKPTSEAAAAAFERTIRQGGDGKLEAKTVRESVVNRPFRIDAISVAVPRTHVSFRPAPAADVFSQCTVKTDAKAKKTILEAPAFGLPVTAIAVNATDRNFSRGVSVLRRMDARWHPLASGRIGAIDLPGEKHASLEIGFGREVREEALRIEIEDGDNPPLSFLKTSGDGMLLPLTLKVAPFDIVFIAAPGETYRIRVVPGAERPRYDMQILGYIERVRDPVRLAVDAAADALPLAGTSSTGVLDWAAVVPFVSVLVFAALGILCIRLLRQNAPPGDSGR